MVSTCLPCCRARWRVLSVRGLTRKTTGMANRKEICHKAQREGLLKSLAAAGPQGYHDITRQTDPGWNNNLATIQRQERSTFPVPRDEALSLHLLGRPEKTTSLADRLSAPLFLLRSFSLCIYIPQARDPLQSPYITTSEFGPRHAECAKLPRPPYAALNCDSFVVRLAC